MASQQADVRPFHFSRLQISEAEKTKHLRTTMLKTKTFYVFVLACACLSLIANAKYIHEGCQDLGSDENLAKAWAAGKADVVGQMRKQREERVECNLDCRLLGGGLDASP